MQEECKMSSSLSKREQAIEACEKVINGIEDGTISVQSSLLLCKKIARLVNDLDGQEWLNYEYGGYPCKDGIPHSAWEIGAKHGRVYNSKDENGENSEFMFKDLMEDGNPEHYAQVLTSCRRLWSETAKTLFAEVLPGYSAKGFMTKSGKEIDISGDHDNNKLSAVIETLQSKAAENTLVGSETIYLIDWMEQINKRQSTGVHADVSREQAVQCIIHTYIALGDILSLKSGC